MLRHFDAISLLRVVRLSSTGDAWKAVIKTLEVVALLEAHFDGNSLRHCGTLTTPEPNLSNPVCLSNDPSKKS